MHLFASGEVAYDDLTRVEVSAYVLHEECSEAATLLQWATLIVFCISCGIMEGSLKIIIHVTGGYQNRLDHNDELNRICGDYYVVNVKHVIAHDDFIVLFSLTCEDLDYIFEQ